MSERYPPPDNSMNRFVLGVATMASVASLSLFGCGDDEKEQCGGTPAVTITAPADNAVVTADDAFTVAVDNFQVVDYTVYLDPTPCEGHVHVYIREPGEAAPGTYIRPGFQGNTFTLNSLFERDLGTDQIPSGSRIIRVELHNNDHSNYDGAISDEITIDIVQ